MGNVFALIFAKLSMGYREIKLYDLKESKCNLDIRQYLMENFKRFLDDGEILLNTYLIKPSALLTILHSIDNDIQFSLKLINNKLPFLDILIKKIRETNLDEHLFKSQLI